MSREPADSMIRTAYNLSASPGRASEEGRSAEQQLLAVMVADQVCGIPVLLVRDVLADQRIAAIPLAPPEIVGNLNLRGRIVTAISVRRKLGLPPPEREESMAVVVEYDRELYALLVDHVTEVITADTSTLEPNPPNLPGTWARVSAGIYPLASCLLVLLDIDALLSKTEASA